MIVSNLFACSTEGVTSLDASMRMITDLTGLEYCVNLTTLNLGANQISDISPLVENSRLSDGDTIDLRGNPLSTTSLNVYTPKLEEKGG